MGIDKLTPLGGSGSLESSATFEDWVDNGFVDERVRYTRLNRQFYRGDSKINETIDRGPKTLSEAGSVSDIVYGIFSNDNSFGHGLQSSNSFDVSGAERICPAIIDGERKILIANRLTRQIKVFDVVSGAVEETVTFASGSFPAASAVVYDLCADDQYVYLSSTYSTDEYIQAFSLSDWSPHPGWPTTGLQIVAGGINRLAISWASEDFLAVNYSNGNLVYLIDKTDGTVDDSGSGDRAGISPGNVASNGTYLFAPGGGSISIANMAVGCGGTGWGVSSLGSKVCCLGNMVFATNLGGTVYAYNTENFKIATAQSSTNSIVKTLRDCATDGIYLWAIGTRTVGSTDREFIFRIDLSWANNENSTTIEARTDLETYVKSYAFDHSNTHAGSSSINEDIIFDGRDIWFTDNRVDPDYLYRIPSVQLR